MPDPGTLWQATSTKAIYRVLGPSTVSPNLVECQPVVSYIDHRPQTFHKNMFGEYLKPWEEQPCSP